MSHCADAPGGPRPWVATPTTARGRPGVGDRMPVPWVNGSHALGGDFLQFKRHIASVIAERLCFACGGSLLEISVMGLLREGSTDGPPGHPRCLALAAGTCPHLLALEPSRAVAFAHTGRGPAILPDPLGVLRLISPDATSLTRRQLERLSSADPLGRSAASLHAVADAHGEPAPAGCVRGGP